MPMHPAIFQKPKNAPERFSFIKKLVFFYFMVAFFVFFVVVLVLCDICSCWLRFCSTLVWYLSIEVHSFSVFDCLFWVVEWCKPFRFDARNFLPPVTLLLRKKKTSSVESRGRHFLRDSTEEVFFRSCNVNYGRQLLPWVLTDDVFRGVIYFMIF